MTSRTDEIDAMGTIGIVPCANQLGNHVDIKELAIFDGVAFDRNRKEIAGEYNDFLRTNGLI